jgi:hypothetical protein
MVYNTYCGDKRCKNANRNATYKDEYGNLDVYGRMALKLIFVLVCWIFTGSV